MQYIDLDANSHLTDRERSAIREHCILSGLIKRITDIRSFLIKQVNEKCSDFKNGRYKIREPLIDKLVSAIIFGGKKRLNSFDTFPSSFMCCLYEQLCSEVSVKSDPYLEFGVWSIYYKPEEVPLEELQTAMQFNASDWELQGTPKDQEILFRFREDFIEALNHLMEAVKRFGNKQKQITELRRETARYTKIARRSPFME